MGGDKEEKKPSREDEQEWRAHVKVQVRTGACLTRQRQGPEHSQALSS